MNVRDEEWEEEKGRNTDKLFPAQVNKTIKVKNRS